MNTNNHKCTKLASNLLVASVFCAICAYAQPYAYVAAGEGYTVSVVNTANNSVVGSISVPGPGGLAVTPDGASVYVTSTISNAVSVINASTNAVVATINVGAPEVQLAVSPNGAQVYTVNQNSNQVSVISTASKSLVANIPVGYHPNGVAFSPDGSRAFVTNTWSNNVSVIDTASSTVINTFSTGFGPSGAVVSPNGTLVYVANAYSNTVTVHNTASGATVATIPGMNYPSSLAITPDGSRVYAANTNGGTVSVIDTNSNTLSGNIGVGNNPMSIAMSPDGTKAYVVNNYDWAVAVINVSSNAVMSTIRGVGIFPNAVAMIPAVRQTQACSYSISPGSASFSSAGGGSSVGVTASPGCTPSASSSTGWLTVTAIVSGTVYYSVAANPGAARNGYLNIAGQIFQVAQAGVTSGGGTNLALGKQASQSSMYPLPTAGPFGAVDGNTDGNYWDGSVSHTNMDTNAWWQVDLGASATVASIAIWNRTDCCSERLSDYWVFVSNTPFATWDTPATLQGRAGTWSSHETTVPSPFTIIAAGGAQGRYVRVQLSGTNFLSLAEVQVTGTSP